MFVATLTWCVFARAELDKQGSGLPHTKSGGFLGLVDRLTSGIIGRSSSGAKQAADAAQVITLTGCIWT